MAVIAVAVIGFFQKNKRGLSAWTTKIAPIVSGLLLLWVFVMIIANFHVMMGQEGPTFGTYVLPIIVLLAGIIGIAWGLALRSSKPEIYRQIGHGTEPGAYGTEAVTVVDGE